MRVVLFSLLAGIERYFLTDIFFDPPKSNEVGTKQDKKETLYHKSSVVFMKGRNQSGTNCRWGGFNFADGSFLYIFYMYYPNQSSNLYRLR